MSKQLVELIANMPGSARRYCHLHLKTFNPNSKENFFLSDFKQISHGKKIKLKSNSTRLYEKLLDILFNYYAPNVDTLHKETRSLKRALVLNKLGMQAQASQVSEDVISSALEDHNYLKCLEAFDLRLQFAFEQEDLTYLNHYVAEYRALKEKMVKDYLDLSDYQTLWMIVKQGAIKHHFSAQNENLNDKYYTQLLARDENELTAEAQIIFLKIKGFMSMQEKKPHEALAYMIRTKAIYDNNPWLTLKDPLEYAKYIKNTCISLLMTDQLEKAKKFIDNFESEIHFNEKNFDQTRLEIKCMILGIQSDIAITGRSFELYKEKFITDEKLVLKHLDKIPSELKVSLLFSLFIMHLHHRNFRRSRSILNQLNNIDPEIRKDLRELAVVGELTLHFLEGNIDLLENRLKSLERKLLTEKPFFNFTPDVLIFFMLKLKDPHKKNLDRYLDDILKEAKGGDKAGYYNYNPLLEMR